MRSFTSDIMYDGKKVFLNIDSASDRDILRTAVGSTIAMALKLDMEYRKAGKIDPEAPATYNVIQAHGGDYALQEGSGILMPKDEAAEKYDVINACNNELWTPQEGTKVAAYALGLINSREVKRGDRMPYIDFKADFKGSPEGYPAQNPEGLRFMINGVPYEHINIGGDCNQVIDAQWGYDEGLDRLVMNNVYDFSKEYRQ